MLIFLQNVCLDFNQIFRNLQAVYTTVDSAAELWNLIPRQPFTILGVRGGTNLFGHDGNYIGVLFLVNGVITGNMIDHWTGNLYTVTGSTYNENDIHFIPYDIHEFFPHKSHLKLGDPINIGSTRILKNSNTMDDYGTVIQDYAKNGTHINFEIRQNGIFVNKIDKDGNFIAEKTICTF